MFSPLVTCFSIFLFFIFCFTFLLCYFVLKKTQFHYTKNFNFNFISITFLTTKITTLHICFIIFKNHKIQKKKKTNFDKFTQTEHFTSISFLFTTNCASKIFFTYNGSPLFNTSSLTTKNYPKKSQKTHSLQKFQTTYPFLLFTLNDQVTPSVST